MDVGNAKDFSQKPGIIHGFFGRKGGTSPREWSSLNTSYDVGDVGARVDENRRRICRSLGLGSATLYTAKQVHGIQVVRVTSDMPAKEVLQTPADALWTTDSNIVLGIQTADCVPVLLASQDGKVVAAIHAGWRSAVGGIIDATISDICTSLSIAPKNLVAAIGPCIGKKSYEVGQEVIDAAQNCVSLDGLIEQSGDHKFQLDLGGLVKRLLEKSSIGQVELISKCTFADRDHFFSHRREKGKTGRQLAVIARILA